MGKKYKVKVAPQIILSIINNLILPFCVGKYGYVYISFIIILNVSIEDISFWHPSVIPTESSW